MLARGEPMAEGCILHESFVPADRSAPVLEITLGELMRGNAAEVPDRIALVEGVADASARRRWTYRQFVDEAEKAARGLMRHFRPGDRVAILAPACAEWIFRQHGLAMAGMVPEPINPAYTSRKFAFVMRNSGAAGVIDAASSRGMNLSDIVAVTRDTLPDLHTIIDSADDPTLTAAKDPAQPMPAIDSALVLEMIETERCEASLLVPSMIMTLLDHPDLRKRDETSLHFARECFNGGRADPRRPRRASCASWRSEGSRGGSRVRWPRPRRAGATGWHRSARTARQDCPPAAQASARP